MTGLPVALKLDLILEVAVLDAALSGLFGVEFEVLGVALKGVGAPLRGVCGSEGAGEGGLLSLSLSKLEGPRSISTPCGDYPLRLPRSPCPGARPNTD